MKKIFLAVFLFNVVFFSSNAFADSKSEAYVLRTKGLSAYADKEYGQAFSFFKQSYTLEPKNDENGYYLGLTSLQLNNLSSAEKYFGALLKRNPDYEKAYFQYGLSLYREKKFDKALPWFKKEEDKKDTPLPLFYSGLSYFSLKNKMEALLRLKKVEKDFAGSETATAATGWIAKIEGREQPPPSKKEKEGRRWNLRASAGGFYDSNVIRNPDNEALAGFTHQNAYASVGALDFKYLLAHGEKSKFFGGYSGYQSVYLNHSISDFNYGRHMAAFDFIYNINDFLQWRIPFNYSFVALGKAKYVQTAGATSAIDAVWLQNLMTTLTLGGEWDKFFGTFTNVNQNRNGSKAIGKIEQYFFAPNNREFYIKGGVGFEKNMASGNDWDYQSYNIYASLQTPLPLKFKLLLFNDITARRNFLHIDSIYNIQRQDIGTISTAILSREISKLFTLSASYSYAITDSNIIRFSYHRQVGGLTLQVKL